MLLAATTRLAEEGAALEAGPVVSESVWVHAVILAGLHLLAVPLRRYLDQYATFVSAFAGGMSVTYVFGHLLPELTEAHEVVGELIYLFVLTGFVAYYYLERRVRLAQYVGGGGDHRHAFGLALGGYWLYNWLIVFGLPDGPGQSLAHIALMTSAIGLHLIHSDYALGKEHPHHFDRWGRFAVAAAPLVGLACRYLFRPEAELIKDILVAALAGSVMLNVFKRELPNPEKNNFGGFLIGVVTYAALLIAVRRL